MSYGYLRKLGLRTIGKKKQRTFLTIGATLLCCAVINVTLLLFFYLFSMYNGVNEGIDPYHYLYQNQDEISFSSRYHVFKEYDTNLTIDHQPLYSFEMEGDVAPFILIEGALPTDQTEILVKEGTYLLGQQIEEYSVVGTYQSSSTDYIYTTNIQGQIQNYYLKDELVYLTSSYQDLVNYYDLDQNQLICHDAMRKIDTIDKILPDIPFMLFIFVVVFVLCILMSLIAIQNILIISDKDQKKEVGLLKSVGCSPKGIRYLLFFELLILGSIGAILGVGIGTKISQMIIETVSNRIYVNHIFMTNQTIVLCLLSGLLGLGVFLISGYATYRPLFYSSAISDFKDNHEINTVPLKPSQSNNHSFSWRMFIIYNHRMKKQTKNLLISFLLLLVTSILFSSVFLVTMIYNKDYTNSTIDISVESNGFTNEELMAIFEANPFSTEIQDLSIERTTYLETKMHSRNFDSERLKAYLNQYHLNYDVSNDRINNVNVHFQPTYMTANQIKSLEPYLLWGSLDNVDVYDVVVVLNEDDYYGLPLCCNLNQDSKIVLDYANGLSKMNNGFYEEYSKFLNGYYNRYPEGNPNERNIVAVIALPEEAQNAYTFPFDDYPRVMIFNTETATQIPHRIYDKISITLVNKNQITTLSQEVEDLLKEYDVEEYYTYTNLAIEVISNQGIVFLLETLLYPMFGLLFIMALVNIYYVLTGNLYLKRNDISILKSVGMKSKQLKMMFWYEYLEAYLNASALTTIIFIPIAFFQSQLSIFEAFDFVGNMISSLMMALFIFGPILLVPIILIHMTQFKKISPLLKSTETN